MPRASIAGRRGTALRLRRSVSYRSGASPRLARKPMPHSDVTVIQSFAWEGCVAPKLYGLDDPIVVTGRSTTIREEWQAGKVIPMKQGEQRVGQRHKVLRHSVVIDGETFQVSGADYETVSPTSPAPPA